MAELPDDSDRPEPPDGSASDWDPRDDPDLDPFQQAVLYQDTRREIFLLLSKVPGLNKAQIADRLSIDRRTLDEHLALLESARLVIVEDSERERERLCFLTEHLHLWEDEQTRILYGEAPVRDVALVLVDHEPCRTDILASIVGRRPSTIRGHLIELRDCGLAEKVHSTRALLHTASEELRSWVNEWGDRYERPWIGEE